jgi:3-isopropylmalate/(R)-2-methylmalate dehydratase small subunit
VRAFKTFTGIVVPLDRPNVDTDAIIPKQYLKSIHRTGFGVTLFDDWRYLEPGKPGDDHSKRMVNTDFVLNHPRYEKGEILLARKNFGCGSSREHAVWALMDYGFKVVIAPSYADIFFSNTLKNGLLPIVLTESELDELFEATIANEGYQLTVNLEEQSIITPDGHAYSFDIDPGYKNRLLQGLDEIGITLKDRDAIRAYEDKARQLSPWLFGDQI